jgi:hypothetical protein
MSKELQQKVLNFMEKSQAKYGRQVHIYEALSVGKTLFDRHCTAYTSIAFILRRISWRVSGGRIIFQGQDNFFYEIASDLITSLEEESEEKVTIFEQYAENCFRRSTFSFISQ